MFAPLGRWKKLIFASRSKRAYWAVVVGPLVGACASIGASAQAVTPIVQPITIRLVPGYTVECAQTQDILTADNQRQRSKFKSTLRTDQINGQTATILESEVPQVQIESGRTVGPFKFAMKIQLSKLGDFEDAEVLKFQIAGVSEAEIRSERAKFGDFIDTIARKMVSRNFSYLGKPIRSGDSLKIGTELKSALEASLGIRISGTGFESTVLGESLTASGEPILVIEQKGEGKMFVDGKSASFRLSGTYSAYQRSGLIFESNQTMDMSISPGRSAKVSETTNCRQVSKPTEKNEINSPGEFK